MRNAAGQMPISPFEPPVTVSHWYAIDQTICANASVSIARYTPDRRTQNQPKTMAATSAAIGAPTSATGIGHPAFTAIADAYAPTPKYAAWPKDVMPPVPSSNCRLAANSAAIRMSVASTNA